MSIGRFAGSSVIFRNSVACSSFGSRYTTGMLKYLRPTSFALASSSAARCSPGVRRLRMDFTPSAFSFASASSLGCPLVQNCSFTSVKLLMPGCSFCISAPSEMSVAAKRLDTHNVKIDLLILSSSLGRVRDDPPALTVRHRYSVGVTCLECTRMCEDVTPWESPDARQLLWSSEGLPASI